ncbi:F-box protein SKIP23-like [Durio zibethinus]|uniref:F-box protein SKIP23-like n=1 Tax=Durio zibethinus TaxID=66656 RepID=A0A6P6B5Y5_DURZI|nr:F-box protein SKIP23-like [Durio zibethinus]XP_022772598.1 F-box protein SKIP23-like [Durio zibethinus]XP_022772599.1 F-box protein SKIP23-like [Durio zibethinus]
MGVDWTKLPPELLESIAENVKIYADYIRFRAVCRSWRSSIPKIPFRLPPQLPWLMLPPSQSHGAFYDLSTNKVRFLSLPESSNPTQRHCGSSHGWLIILDESPSILLLNPFSRANLLLPPLSTFPNVDSFNYSDIGKEYSLRSPSGGRYTRNLRQMRDSFIKKIVLSANPSKDLHFVAIAILNQTGELAYCKNGDESWRFIEDAQSYSQDVIYCKGLCYAVDKQGGIVICDVRHESPRVSFIETPRQLMGDMQYLVNSGDELLLVTRHLDLDFNFEPDQYYLIYRTKRFEVSRLVWRGPHWERVKSLYDKMLFIGENSSLSLSASDFTGCKGNCIYFTDDYSETNYDGAFGEHDIGIYKLWDGSIEPLPCYPRNSFFRLHWPTPLWITPSPC